ncbi:MAG: hypothetical protein LOD91_01815, partial [Limnochordales bacterium]
MQRATRVIRKAELGSQASAQSITLDRASRFRRRVAMKTDDGVPFLLDLPEATYLADGDALV